MGVDAARGRIGYLGTDKITGARAQVPMIRWSGEFRIWGLRSWLK